MTASPSHRLWVRLIPVLVCLLAAGWSGRAGAAEPVALEAGPDGIQRGTITLNDVYTPSHIVVQAGKPVELVLTSSTAITPHNFIVDDPAAGFKVEQEVGAGKTVTVRFTPPRPGVFVFYCDKKLLFFKSHREKGMEGRLEVR